jgi:hypothetical protein
MLLNYTTKIDPDKTCAEIGKILSKHGAQAVMTEYDTKNQLVSALSFKIAFGEKQIAFRLPADWRPVQRVLQEQGVKADQMMAVRVSWRIIKDWVEAQLALCETQMVNVQTVFLPYAITRDGMTLGEKMLKNPNQLLGSGQN